MQRFRILQPPATHFRQVRCEAADCRAHIEGWATVLNQDDPAHGEMFALLRASGRAYTQMRSEEAAEQTGKPFPGGLTAFLFPPGQQCFEKHLVPVGREPIFVHERGGNRRVHQSGLNFNEHFNEQVYRIRG